MGADIPALVPVPGGTRFQVFAMSYDVIRRVFRDAFYPSENVPLHC